MFAAFDAVVFDAGGVLLEWQPLSILAQVEPEVARHQELLGQIFAHSDWIELDRGVIEESESIQRFAERTSLSVDRLRYQFEVTKQSVDSITIEVTPSQVFIARPLMRLAVVSALQALEARSLISREDQFNPPVQLLINDELTDFEMCEELELQFRLLVVRNVSILIFEMFTEIKLQ